MVVCESQPRSAVLILHFSFPSLWEPTLKINISPFVSMATVLHFTECTTRVGGNWKWHRVLVRKLTRVNEASQILLIWNLDWLWQYVKKKKSMNLLDISSQSLSAQSWDYNQRPWLQFDLCPLSRFVDRLAEESWTFVASLKHAEHLLFSFCVAHSSSKYYLMPFIRICCWDCWGDFHLLSFKILMCASSFLTFYVMEVSFHAALLFHRWKALHWHEGSC